LRSWAVVGPVPEPEEAPPWHDAAAVRTLYRPSRVHTLAHPSTGEWVLIDGRHVQRVGSGEPPEADRVVDLPGTTIVPGFVDAHVHLMGTGLSLSNEDVGLCASKEELLELAAARAADEGQGAVLLQGFDETRWTARELPTIGELDAVGRQLVIRRADGHVALANLAAIDAAGILDTAGCERDDSGRPTGRVTLEANAELVRWAMGAFDDHRIEELQLQAAGLAASRGVTSIHEMSMPHEAGFRDVEVLLRHRSRLPVDTVPIVATMDIPRVIDLGLPAIGGDLPVDGSVGARTAAVSAPYVEAGGTGHRYYDDDTLAEFFHGGHSAGLQVGVHAIGDDAIEQVLGVWERVYGALESRERRHFRARRHRIEHFEMASARQVERAAVLGLAVSVQPAFDRIWGGAGGLYETGLGAARAAAMNPFRTLLERGLEVGGGSDTPVTPLDPMLSVSACERHHDPVQRLTRSEAIRLHTIGGARLAHQEDKKGALGIGMHADFAAYEADPFEEEILEGLRPVLTVSLGREVFRS
jgi:predicted amidohydrolase YtcJ